MTRIMIARLLALVLCLSSAAGRAEEDPDLLIARGHFRKGQLRFEANDVKGALAEFETARATKAVPEFDYNIGVCLERLDRREQAADAFERYVGAIVDPQLITETRERIARLRVGPRRRPERAPAIAVGVTTLTLAVVGTALVASVAPEYNRLHDQWAVMPSEDLRQRVARLEIRADVGYAMWALAGAAAIAEIVLLARLARAPHAPSPRAATHAWRF